MEEIQSVQYSLLLWHVPQYQPFGHSWFFSRMNITRKIYCRDEFYYKKTPFVILLQKKKDLKVIIVKELFT